MQQSYFLGANTPEGFYSLFSELYSPYDEWNMYIIKGGPGTGKSSLIKKIAAAASEYNLNTDLIHCSSDPLSLDGVIIPEIKTAICDGTSPHIVEPIFPGVCEHIVNLSECWDTNKLNDNKSKIKIMTLTNKKAHQKSISYLKTAKIFDNEMNNIIKPFIKFDKIDRYAERFTQLNYNNLNGEITKKTRFLSAFSPAGISINYDTFLNACETVLLLKDNYNISKYIINALQQRYNKSTVNYICPLDPKKTEHIIFTDIKFGIFSCNKYHKIINNKFKSISTSRFVEKEKIDKYKNSINFLNNCKKEMINESIKSLETAKATHDLLESYYIEAMDFNKVDKITEQLINTIFK